jgi:four helix bundle protein
VTSDKGPEQAGQHNGSRNPCVNPKPASYRDLLVWQKGMALAKEIYRITRSFPADERFGLISQMRRAAVSVPSNIAEGQARRTTNEFIQFISQAEGSLAELDTQLTLSSDLGYCVVDQAACPAEMIAELKKMLNALRRTLANPK